MRPPAPQIWHLAQGRMLDLTSKPIIMGILNVTPDSFSDGGKWVDDEIAFAHAERMLSEGADIIDIGAESTRPGHQPISAQEEIKRLAPHLKLLAEQTGAIISVDTSKSSVAEFALQAGAHIINDIWGLQNDPSMAGIIAQHQAGVVIMHNRQSIDENIDIIDDIKKFFLRSIDRALQNNIQTHHIVLDPGVGFGKTFEQNLKVIANIDQFITLGFPVLIGASRKSFIGKIIESQPEERIAGTISANLIAREAKASIFRVHDVAECRQALLVAEKILEMKDKK